MTLEPGNPVEPPVAGVAAFGRRLQLGLAAAVVLLLGAGSFWAVRHWRANAERNPSVSSAPEDPRLHYDGPFQNVRPDVAYVGSAACASCHEREAASYNEHPMGRSLLPVSRVAASQRYDVAAHNPFEALGTHFEVVREGDRVVHRQIGRDDEGKPVYQSDMQVDYVLGSGFNGHSYLTNRDGYLYQTPVSWFSQKQIWDKSPGFGGAKRHGRPVGAACLFCHANRARAMDGYVNRYEQPIFDGYAIGCERCHGPGQLHVAGPGLMRAGIDPTIVNPRHLDAELRSAVCEQCHLVGEVRVLHRGRGFYDFRPGMPSEAFLSIYVRSAEPGEKSNAVSHVEQLYQSACFAGSVDDATTGRRKLGCVSCHDPHRHVGAAERVGHYRDRCLQCHQQRGCNVPEPTRRKTSKDDSCIDCHMPRYASAAIAHTAATNHRIVRRPESPAALSPSQAKTGPGLISFYTARSTDSPESERNMGVGLAEFLVSLSSQRNPSADRLGRRALHFLDTAIARAPDDLEALEARARVLALMGRTETALEAYESVLAKYPHRESSLLGAAITSQNGGELGKALGYWQRLTLENPWEPTHRSTVAVALARRQDWAEALVQARAWLSLDPASIEARAFVVGCLIAKGDKAAARDEFTALERLRPANLPSLRERFAAELEPK